MTMQTCVEYVSNHKKEILLGALCTVGAGVLIALGVKGLSSINTNAKPVEMVGDIVSDSNEWMNRNVVEGFTTGKVNDLWNEGNYGNAIVQFFTIKDMGKLGEDLTKIKGVTEDTEVSAVLTFVNTKVEI